MKLVSFSVENYRSITSANKIEIENQTILIGKNNEGKTNILKALVLAFKIVSDAKRYNRRIFPLSQNLYNKLIDYPIGSKKQKRNTSFHLVFLIDETERNALFDITGSKIKKNFSIHIEIFDDNTVSITSPKQGKTQNLTKHIIDVAAFVCQYFDCQYVPAIRSEYDAIEAIDDLLQIEFDSSSDEEYKKSLQVIKQHQEKIAKNLSAKVQKQLKEFLPDIKKINIRTNDRYRSFSRRRMTDVEIDDGVSTSISQKGDGVKSLIVIALLGKISNDNNRLIIVDEPENHLHPKAIHYIKNVLFNVPSNNQVIISTHSPIFVNRQKTSSNIIVEKNKAVVANRIDDIRNALGVLTSDNLQYSDYEIVVEGPLDKAILACYINKNFEDLSNLIKNGKVQIRSIGGTRNLIYELNGLERYFCKYMIILDDDQPGKEAKNNAIAKLSINENRFRQFSQNSPYESELEDLYKKDVYEPYLIEKGFVLDCDGYKNKSKKWSVRLKSAAEAGGIQLTETLLNEYKNDIAKKIIKNINENLTQNAKKQLDAILHFISKEILSVKF